MNHNIAPQLIKEVFSIAPEAWLFGATLLGAVRDGRIISWDRDVDLGILSDHVSLEMLDKFRSAGFKVYGVYFLDIPEMEQYVGKDGMGKFGKFILSKNGVKIEMCIFTRGKELDQRGKFEEPMLYYASGTPRFFVLPESCVLPLKKIPFYGFEVNIPENAAEQLEFVYGVDWGIPRPSWYFTADHYLRRDHTIIELKGDDGTRWSKWSGRKQIEKEYGPQEWPDDINTPLEIIFIRNI